MSNPVRRTRKRGATESVDAPASKRQVVGRVNKLSDSTILDASGKQAIKATAQKTKQALPLTQPVKLQAYVCGDGSAGELGLGAGRRVTDVQTPRLNSNLAGVVALATGGMHAAALTDRNEVLTWGINDLGTLARDTKWEAPLRDQDEESSDDEDDVGLNPKEATPTAVAADNFPAGTRFKQVDAGDSTTFVLTEQGDVYGWGTFRNHKDVYGFTYDQKINKIVDKQLEPLLIPNLKNIIQINVGADYALALDDKGQAYAWGCGEQHELGRQLVERRRPLGLLPSRVEIPHRVKIRYIYAASNHAFAIDANGDTWAWGSNNFGQTGITTNAGQPGAIVATPTRVPSLVGRNTKSVVGGLHHSIGLTESGKCLAWGRVDGGQSGIDLSTLNQDDSDLILRDMRNKPAILLQPTELSLPKCEWIASGSAHSFALTSTGKAYSWGFNALYQCGQKSTNDILVATLIDGKHVRDKTITWAGAGGQYSMLASNF